MGTDQIRVVRIPAAVAASLFAALIMAPGPALAAPTVLNFNELSDGQVVTDAYAAKKVTFKNAVVYQDEFVSFLQAKDRKQPITMTFTSPVSRVRLAAGEATTHWLTGDTANGGSVEAVTGATSPTTVTWPTRPLEIASAFGIRSATLRTNGSLPARLDNLEFDLGVVTTTISGKPVDFGKVTRGETGAVKATFSVASTGTVALSVAVGVGGNTADFPIAHTCGTSGGLLAAGKRCDVTVTFKPTALGPRHGELVVTHNGPRKEQRFALDGTGVAPPAVRLAVKPDRLTFEGPSSHDVTIENTGTLPVTVTGVVLEPATAGFTRSDCPSAALAVGASCVLRVQFVPPDGREHTASLVVSATSRTGDLPVQRIALTGRPITTTVVPPTLAVTPTTAEPNGEIAVTGRNFRGLTRVYWDTEDDESLIGESQVGASGELQVTTRVATDSPDGARRIVACDESGTCVGTELIVSRSDPPRIPVTLVIAGAVLFGALALGLLRRRAGRGRGDHGDGGDGDGDGGDGDDRAGPAARRDREVRTGFSRADDLAADIEGALVRGRPYHFWLELGPAVRTPSGRPATVSVAIFAFDGEIEVDAEAGSAELKIGADGVAGSVRQGGLHGPAQPDREILERRVHFAVRAGTGTRGGRQRLRASVYHHNVLLQSWLISAPVRRRWPFGGKRPPIERERDYVVARSLDPDHLAGFQPHRLSILVNDNPAGTHGLRVMGQDGFPRSSELPKDVMDRLRQSLHEQLEQTIATTGQGSDAEVTYRYEGGRDLTRLASDLGRLALWGSEAYAHLSDRLFAVSRANVRADRERFEAMMRTPGRVQIVNKGGVTDIVPAAFFYDHPFDHAGQRELCPTFTRAVTEGAPLDESACFRGDCPSYGDRNVVCPSGFWGFRHVIGMPPSLGDGGAADAPTEIGAGADTAVPVAVSTDPGFVRRPGHQARLAERYPGVRWQPLEARSDVLEHLARVQPFFVYFYCHGGREQGVGFVEVGPAGSPAIIRSDLRSYRVLWDRSHPLVFLNGCHTASVGAETPMDLVTTFVEECQAAGVIGSHVTLFEPLACDFAERLFDELVVGQEAVGDAIWATRLSLLAEGNPLGLVYLPFVSDDLRFSASLAPALLGAASGGPPQFQ